MVLSYIMSQGQSERSPQSRLRPGRGTRPWPWTPRPIYSAATISPMLHRRVGHHSWSSQACEVGNGVPISQTRKQCQEGQGFKGMPTVRVTAASRDTDPRGACPACPDRRLNHGACWCADPHVPQAWSGFLMHPPRLHMPLEALPGSWGDGDLVMATVEVPLDPE